MAYEVKEQFLTCAYEASEASATLTRVYHVKGTEGELSLPEGPAVAAYATGIPADYTTVVYGGRTLTLLDRSAKHLTVDTCEVTVTYKWTSSAGSRTNADKERSTHYGRVFDERLSLMGEEAVEYTDIDGRTMGFDGSGAPLHMPKGAYSFKVRMRPFQELWSCINTINSEPFPPVSGSSFARPFYFPAGCCLYLGSSLSPVEDVGVFDWCWEMELQFGIDATGGFEWLATSLSLSKESSRTFASPPFYYYDPITKTYPPAGIEKIKLSSKLLRLVGSTYYPELYWNRLRERVNFSAIFPFDWSG